MTVKEAIEENDAIKRRLQYLDKEIRRRHIEFENCDKNESEQWLQHLIEKVA